MSQPTLSLELTPKQAYAVLVAFLSRPTDHLLDSGTWESYEELIQTLQFPEGYAHLSEEYKQHMYALFSGEGDQTDEAINFLRDLD